jgi:hypothetical protein
MATKFYLHRATANPPGTFPAAATALGGTPTVKDANAGTLRWIDGTISGVAQTSAVSTTDGTSNAQTAWHTRHVSAPLAAQTISAQTLTYSLAAAEANAGSNFNPSIYVSLWRPSTGLEVGAIMAVGTITATEPGTTQTATSGTGTSTQQIAQAGDVIIIETWRKSVAPGATTARTNTTFYDGTTEASTTNVASFVNFANTLTFQAIGPQPTALVLTFTGATPTVVATDNKTAAPTTLVLTFTGATPTVAVTNNVVAQPTALALTFTGATPTVSTPVQVSPSALALAWTGATPSVTTPVQASPSALAMTLTGAIPTIATPVQASPAALALTLTGATPQVSTPVAVNPAALALAVAFATPSVTTGDAIQVTPGPLALGLTFATPIVTVSSGSAVNVQPAALALALAFAIPTVTVSGQAGPPAGPFQGGLQPAFRGMVAVPFNGPTVGARIITAGAISAATARHRSTHDEEDELLLLGD